MSVFSYLIKEKRLSMNLSIRAAAKKIGISYTYLDNLEKGVDRRSGVRNKPTPETLKLIAEAYHLNYTYLLSLFDYIESTDLPVPVYLQELFDLCKDLSYEDIDDIVRYVKFIIWQRKEYLKLPH